MRYVQNALKKKERNTSRNRFVMFFFFIYFLLAEIFLLHTFSCFRSNSTLRVLSKEKTIDNEQEMKFIIHKMKMKEGKK